MNRVAQVTERSFYPALMDVIRDRGGSAVSEVHYVSQPDIIFDLLGRKWLLAVKIGETPAILRSAFIQYYRHKADTGIDYGLLLFLPEPVRDIQPTQTALENAVASYRAVILVDTIGLKAEYSDVTFPQAVDRVIHEVAREERGEFPLKLVLSLLREHVQELMSAVEADSPAVLRVITDKALLSNLGHIRTENAEAAGRFLAAYVFLSQIMFLRLLVKARPAIFGPDLRPATHSSLRAAFRRVLNINYRPIYEVEVLDYIPEVFLKDTFDLIWGLEVERVRYELPGRIFHDLMPPQIRKMLAAFYTRPQAADLLAHLSIQKSDETIFDPACGSGTILVSA